MKKRLIALIAGALALAPLADATLISLADWRGQDPLPQAFIDFVTSKKPFRFFDEARSKPYDVFGTVYPPGWVSQFGSLDGGNEFNTNLFAGGPLNTANVSWDFGETGIFMKYIEMWGQDYDGTLWTRLYQVPYHFQFQDSAELVQLNPKATGEIVSIAFYGGSIFNLPDGGSTAGLLGIGLAAIAAVKRFR